MLASACAMDDEELEEIAVVDSSGKADGFGGRRVLATYVTPPLQIITADREAFGTARVLTETAETVRLRLRHTIVHPTALESLTRIHATTSRTGVTMAFAAMTFVGGSIDQLLCKNARAEAGLFTALTLDPASRTIDANDDVTFTFAECGIDWIDWSDVYIAVAATPLPGAANYVGDYPFIVTVESL